jgi:hypothetical protein
MAFFIARNPVYCAWAARSKTYAYCYHCGKMKAQKTLVCSYKSILSPPEIYVIGSGEVFCIAHLKLFDRTVWLIYK